VEIRDGGWNLKIEDRKREGGASSNNSRLGTGRLNQGKQKSTRNPKREPKGRQGPGSLLRRPNS